MQRTNFQSRTCETLERLCNHSDASARFDRRDEAGDAIVFLNNLRRTVQWRKQIGNPCLMFRIVHAGKGNKTLSGDLFQPDSARPRQWMRRMQGHANGLTLQFKAGELYAALDMPFAGLIGQLAGAFAKSRA